MNLDALDAIPRLAQRGLLPPEAAHQLERVAREERFSLYYELRLLLWAGVTLVSAGVGILTYQNLDRIGPLAITFGLGLGAAASLAWVVWKAPRFSWREVPSPNLAFDYLLVLGLGLLAADLAYVEVHFSPLGKDWPWHLLLVSLLYAGAAIRFDSRMVWSLALSTFLAWGGLALSYLGLKIWRPSADELRYSALACGVLFVVLGWGLKRLDRKAHFEPIATHLGWLAILGGMVGGLFQDQAIAWSAALLAVGLGLGFGAFRFRHYFLFALGVLASYIAVTRIVFETGIDVMIGCFWFSASGLAFVAFLILAQRKMKEPH